MFLRYDTEMAVSERVVAGNSNKVECTHSLSSRAVSDGGRNPNRLQIFILEAEGGL